MWRTLVAGAERAGWLVLTCAPAESEAALSFAALADLLRPLAARVPEVPGPQRVAAEVVLLASDSGRVVDERAIGAATRSLLEERRRGDGSGTVAAVHQVGHRKR